MDENEKPKPMGEVIQIDEARLRDHLEEMVCGTVEEALNAMLNAQADRLCGALASTSAARVAGIPEPAAMNVRSTPRPGR